MSPTPRAALAVGAVALTAFLLPWWLVALLEVAVLTATAVDALVVRRASVVSRDLPHYLARGVSAPIRVVPEPAPGRVRVRQPATPDLRVEPSEADGALEAKLVPRRRGRHTLPAPALRITGPTDLSTESVPSDSRT